MSDTSIISTTDALWFDQTFAGSPLMAILRGTGVTRSAKLATTA